MTEQIIKDQTPHCSKHVLGDDFSFILRDTECNSKVFGACEICGKDAAQVFHQKRYKKTLHPITKQEQNQFITDCYGHYDCLIKIRNNYEKVF